MDDAVLDEWLVLVSLGTGLNGPDGIVHGRLAMTLLDSAMVVRALRATGKKPVVTQRYEVDFRRKVKVPRVVLCRAWIDSRVKDGRKDGEGHREQGNIREGEGEKQRHRVYKRIGRGWDIYSRGPFLR